MKSNVTVLLFLWFSLVGCIEKKQLLFEATMVSATRGTAPTAKLTKGSYGHWRWCDRDKTYAPPKKDDEPAGALDQVIAKAAESEKADYFLDAIFYLEMNCVIMTANVGVAKP